MASTDHSSKIKIQRIIRLNYASVLFALVAPQFNLHCRELFWIPHPNATENIIRIFQAHFQKNMKIFRLDERDHFLK